MNGITGQFEAFAPQGRERVAGFLLFLCLAALPVVPLVLSLWGRGPAIAGAIVTVGLSTLLVKIIVQRASRSLQVRERRYRDLVAESFGLICTHDSNGVLLMVNPAAAQGLGYSQRELEGKNLRELLAPAARGFFDEYLDRVKSGQPTEGLMRVVTRQGEGRVWMYRNHLVANEGEAPYVLGHAMDVTERMREEKVLRQHAAELGLANAALQAEIDERARAERERDRFFDMSVELLCIAGFDGYFKQLNLAWERVLGFTLEELRSRPSADFVHP
ncbi:MAG TPA: PAS domain S-box protein, partial [Thermoanaerobaculia bacterium]|nr:PAS domain S-box protein [Thermoanaerobaculia bacterium]